MKNKGFTLAELLGVVVIISLLLLIMVPLIINGVQNREGDVNEAQQNIIYDAANQLIDDDPDQYPENSGDIYCISLRELVNDGKLVDPVKKIVSTGNYDLDNTAIEVRVTNNKVKSYKIREGESEVNKCNKNDNTEAIKIITTPSNDVWSQTKKVKIIYPNIEGEAYTHYYSIDGTEKNIGSSTEFDLDPFNKEHDYAIKAWMENDSGQKINQNGEVSKIDVTAPKISNLKKGKWNNYAKQMVSADIEDDLSGVTKYSIESASGSTINKNYKLPGGEKGTINQLLSEGTYTISVEDNSIKDEDNSSKNKVKSASVTVDDFTPPTITSIGLGEWNDNAEQYVSITMTDTESGVNGYCVKTNSAKPNANDSCFTKFEIDANGGSKTAAGYYKEGQYYIFAKDRTNNVTEYNAKNSFEVKDDTPPTCYITPSGTPGNGGWFRSNVAVQFTASDDNSGISNYGFAQSASAASSFSKLTTGSTGYRSVSASYPHTSNTSSSGVSYYGYVRDKAGNVSSCNDTFKKDDTPPTISDSVNTTKYSYQSGTTTKYYKEYYLNVTASDSHSGLATLVINGTSYTGSTSVYLGSSRYGNVTTSYTISATDNAGNSTGAKNGSFNQFCSRYQNVNPSCSVTCGGGTRTYADYYTGEACEVQSCNNQACPCTVNVAWRACNVTCGTGTQVAYDTVTGQLCPSKNKTCTLAPCYKTCDKTISKGCTEECGGGKERLYDSKNTNYFCGYGNACNTQPCEDHRCDNVWWGECSEKCGGGLRDAWSTQDNSWCYNEACNTQACPTDRPQVYTCSVGGLRETNEYCGPAYGSVCGGHWNCRWHYHYCCNEGTCWRATDFNYYCAEHTYPPATGDGNPDYWIND